MSLTYSLQNRIDLSTTGWNSITNAKQIITDLSIVSASILKLFWLMCKETCTFLKLSNGSLQFNLHSLHPCSLYTMLKKINRYFLEVNKEVFNNDAWTCNRIIIKIMQVLSVPVIFIPVFSKLTFHKVTCVSKVLSFSPRSS